MQRPDFFLLLGMLLFFYSCQNEPEKISIPEPVDIYAFPFATKVDAHDISCDYEIKEYLSDILKRFVRNHTPELTIKRQKQLGREFHEKHLPAPIVHNHPKEALVKDIVERMKPHLKNPYFDHDVYIVSTPSPNAFTVVGGRIYVTTGLLDRIDVEDELAYIIGHELGHNENYHTKEGGRIISFASDLENDLEGQSATLRNILKLIGGITILKAHAIASGYFDQPDELESDLAGIYLAYKIGYDPEKALGGIRKLMQWEGAPPEGEFTKILEDLGRTHPWAEDRYQCASDYVRRAKKRVACGKIFETPKPAQVMTRKDPLSIREYPWSQANKQGNAPKDSIVKMVCACDQTDVINGKKGRWIYIQSEDGTLGWVWGWYLNPIEETITN
jgi:hypothetical protein